MGVYRLYTYIKDNKSKLIDYVDLVEIAKSKPGGIKLLVDFYCWEHYIWDNFKKSMENNTKNQYTPLYGGEYKAINDYTSSFILALRNVNIELIFCMDGARGSSDEVQHQKMVTWINRQKENVKVVKKILKWYSCMIPYESFRKEDKVRCCLQEVQNIYTLQKLGCKIHSVLSGEADSFIAQLLLEDDSIVGVYTTDTDFCIFQNSVMFTGDFFDVDNDLGRGHPSVKILTPKKLKCGLVSSDRLCQHFKFENLDSLIELAILVGNDYTSHFRTKFRELGNKIGSISDAAKIIRDCGRVEDYPPFAYYLKTCPELQRSVQHSRAFYSLRLPRDKDEDGLNPVLSVIAEGVRDVTYPGSIFAMYKGKYWHRMIIEETEEAHNTVECALVHLRAHMYTLVLPSSVDFVVECGRTYDCNFERLTAYKVKYTNIPSLDVINSKDLFERLNLFHFILSHQEPIIPQFEKGNYFKSFGKEFGFKCYLLRYYLLLNWNKNLHISPQEFLVMCVWMLGSHNPEVYTSSRIIPDSRCITVENWMLILYRTCYSFLGGLLKVNHEFPSPSEIFSGSVWVALYMASSWTGMFKNKANKMRQITRRQEKHADVVISTILSQKRLAINTIVKDIFPLDAFV